MSRREIEIAERLDELNAELQQIQIDIDNLELDRADIWAEIEELEQEDLDT